MSDSPLSDTLDDLLNDEDDDSCSDDNSQSNEYSLLKTNSSSTNELKIKIKKRKNEQSADSKQHKRKKKSKTQPTYMRRNIRTLLTNDKLQDDTLTALRAEQERLRRLEEINNSFQPIYTHLPTYYNQTSAPIKSNEQDCIVLDDVDDEEDETTNSLSKTKIDPDENISNKETINPNEDSNDSDVQYVDSDTEIVNDKLTQKLQRLHLDDRINVPDANGDIVVNINHPTNDPDLFVPKHLCPVLKPHQIGGIRFMYDNIVESLQHFQRTRGLGCILAHSMGCGKTLQVIAFINTLLQHTIAKSVLIVVPINTIQNWLNEFNRWCPLNHSDIEYKRSFELYLINETSKKFTQRAKIVQNWSQTGGALILGYEMFRLMVIKKNSTTKTSKANALRPITPVVVDLEEEEKNFEAMEDVRNALLNPDLIICDEGHRIKNHQAGVAIALKSIRTQRRIVLTGYPLQNNLIEYWCMVDFVRPNYLGSKLEFCNMFERPILNGQCIDSTAEDGKIMRARAHVLHSLLEGFIQRRGHDVLQTDLPPKTEYVILLKLSNIQRQLYMKFLEAVGALSSSTEKTLNPLRAFAICCKIWNHSDVLYKFVRDRQDGADLDLDFDIEQNLNSSNKPLANKTRSTSRLALNNRASPQTLTVNNPYEPQGVMFSMEKKEFDYDFANAILNSYVCGQLCNGVKFQLALAILELCVQAGDKVLIFSQSLLSLNKLEEFLSQRIIPNTDKKWEKNTNYYRLDGGTSGLEREKLINAFNTLNSNAKLFLLSTRAGCLGINLIAANRVIVMDVSWNPCLDAQAVCRVYRYGQKRHCYIYRLIADFTMEKRIYDRQIAKQGMADRVVDELQPQNPFTKNEVENLLHFAAEEELPAADLVTKIHEITDDPILISACKQYAQSITKIPFTHESLLSDRKEYQLTSAEKRRAEKEYHEEKRMNSFSYRSRLQPSRSYSRLFNGHEPRSFLHTSPSTSVLDPHFPLYQQIRPTASMTPLPYHIQQQSTDRKLEQLKQHGISVEQIVLRSPLEVQLNPSERELIPAGVNIHLIKASRGSYIRTPDGKFFAIRQTQTPSTNGSKILPMPPPAIPPPPPPSLRSFSNPIDQYLFDSSHMLSSTSLPMNDTHNLTDEIDLLVDETSSNTSGTPLAPLLSTSSSAFENLSSWHNDYFQQNNFYSDFFPNDSTLAMLSSSNNIETDNMQSKLEFPQENNEKILFARYEQSVSRDYVRQMRRVGNEKAIKSATYSTMGDTAITAHASAAGTSEITSATVSNTVEATTSTGTSFKWSTTQDPSFCQNASHFFQSGQCRERNTTRENTINNLQNTTDPSVIAAGLSSYISAVTDSNVSSTSQNTLTVDKIDNYLTNMSSTNLTKETTDSILVATSVKQENSIIVVGASFATGVGGKVIDSSNINSVNTPSITAAAILSNQSLIGVRSLNVLIFDKPTTYINVDNTTNKILASSIIMVTWRGNDATRPPIDISLYFKVLSDFEPKVPADYFCSFYDTSNHIWNESGCTKPAYNEQFKRYECRCNHTTIFALVWLPKPHLTRYLNSQDIASLVFQSISILCFLAVVLHIILTRIQNPTSLQIYDLLPLISCAVTMIFFTFFIALAMTTYTKTSSEDQTSCFLSSSVLMFFVYFFLIFMFCTKTSVAYFNYLRFVRLFPAPSYRRLFIMILISFFISIIWVSVAAGLNSNPSYNITQLYPYKLCWFTRDVIYYFLTIPVCIFLFINIVILILLVRCIRKHVSNATTSQRSYEKMKQCVIILLLSSATQGIGWLFGPFLTIVDEKAGNILGWFFIIFNGLEGLWIILLYLIIRSQHMDEQKRSRAATELTKSTTVSSGKRKNRYRDNMGYSTVKQNQIIDQTWKNRSRMV
ncbi:unnamed protein product [Rotaria socialis]